MAGELTRYQETPGHGRDHDAARADLELGWAEMDAVDEAWPSAPSGKDAKAVRSSRASSCLPTYCQAHGHPLVAGELKRDHVQAFIADQPAIKFSRTPTAFYGRLPALEKIALISRLERLRARPPRW
jgi:hypothetical protein